MESSPKVLGKITGQVRALVEAMIGRLGSRFLHSPRFARSPIGLYQRGWGRFLGDRLLMLEHRGRKSGEWRQVCLEVVDRPTAGTFRVVSGLGPRSQWYRNLRADPHCRVHAGRLQGVTATARMVPQDEVPDLLKQYTAAHPETWRLLLPAVEKDLPEGQSLGSWMPMVDLVLDPSPK